MNIFKVIIVLVTSMIIYFSAFSAENDTTVVGGVEMPEVQIALHLIMLRKS